MKIYTPINYYSSRSLIQVFNACYKMGVEDAIRIDDTIQCEEFVDKMYAPMRFGRIIHDYEMDWREWKFTLSQIMYYSNKYKNQGIKFLDSIISYGNYLTCALPIAMDFYLQGIRDFVNYPDKCLLVRFKEQEFVKWDRKLAKIKMDDMVRDVTKFCYSRTHLEQEAYENMLSKNKNERWKEKRGLSKSAYMNFHKEIWRYTRSKEYKVM